MIQVIKFLNFKLVVVSELQAQAEAVKPRVKYSRPPLTRTLKMNGKVFENVRLNEILEINKALEKSHSHLIF